MNISSCSSKIYKKPFLSVIEKAKYKEIKIQGSKNQNLFVNPTKLSSNTVNFLMSMNLYSQLVIEKIVVKEPPISRRPRSASLCEDDLKVIAEVQKR